jgi:hypothetical protein
MEQVAAEQARDQAKLEKLRQIQEEANAKKIEEEKLAAKMAALELEK